MKKSLILIFIVLVLSLGLVYAQNLTCDDARVSCSNCDQYCEQFEGFGKSSCTGGWIPYDGNCGSSGYCSCWNPETREGITCDEIISNEYFIIDNCEDAMASESNCACYCKRHGSYSISYDLPGKSYCLCWDVSNNETLAGCNSADAFCNDSDGGKNYYIKGIATTNLGENEDYCTVVGGVTKLVENYCDEVNNRVNVYRCPYTCQDGACVSINETSQTIPPSGEGSGGGGTTPDTTSPFITEEKILAIPDLKYVEDGGGRTLRFSLQESKIIGETIEANSEIELSESDNKVYATHSGGAGGSQSQIEIKITPDEAVESSRQAIGIDEIMEVKIIEYKDKIVYDIASEKQAKILALIKARARIKTKIDVNSGELIKIQKPWWSFLAIGV